jgi:uncharacterized protein YgbK (DUF1537 family)
MAQVAIIADDLTGAADAAGSFAAAGLTTVLPLRDDVPLAADVVSISTESRELAPDEAAASVRAALGKLTHQGTSPGVLYKKLDSALRGQLRAELLATMDALGERCAIVAPALPAEGRTTIGGRQHIGGVPLEESMFGGAGISSDLIATFAGAPAISVTAIDLETLRSSPAALSAAIANRRDGIFVVDAVTEDDLRRIAENALASGVRVLAGSAGLARALVQVASLTSTASAPEWRPAGNRPILTIAGTRHQATIRQIEHASATGIRVIYPEQWCLDTQGGGLGDAVDAVEQELRRGRHVILTSAGMQRSPHGPLFVANRLALVVGSNTVRELTGGLILTGGDVASAVCRQLGADSIWLRGEVRPALPWGTLAGGAMPGGPVVTKAGSFGDGESLVAATEHLSRSIR